MAFFKENHHKLLTVLLLLGALLILGSFSSESPKPAIAASNDNDESNTIFREVFMPFENLLAMLFMRL